MTLRIVKRTWTGGIKLLRWGWVVLTWSPLKGKPWHYHAMNSLWCIGLLFLLINMSWNDGIWHYDGSGVEGDPGIPVEDELTIEEWNQIPLDLGDGMCLNVSDRSITNC